MGKKQTKSSAEDNEFYQFAQNIYQSIKECNEEIRILDEAISQLQLKKIKDEVEKEKIATPFWGKKLKITTTPRYDKFFGELDEYCYGKSILLTEAEMIMLRSFKEARLKQLNEIVQKISNEVNQI